MVIYNTLAFIGLEFMACDTFKTKVRSHRWFLSYIRTSGLKRLLYKNFQNFLAAQQDQMPMPAKYDWLYSTLLSYSEPQNMFSFDYHLSIQVGNPSW